MRIFAVIRNDLIFVMKLCHLKSTLLLRLQHLPMPSRGWRPCVCKWAGVSIASPKTNFIGRDVEFDALYPEDIIIEEKAIIALKCTILSHFLKVDDNDDFHFERGKVVIGKHAYIGANTIIVKPVTIGEGAIVGASSVVTKDIPPFEIWAGNPVRFIRKREPDKL